MKTRKIIPTVLILLLAMLIAFFSPGIMSLFLPNHVDSAEDFVPQRSLWDREKIYPFTQVDFQHPLSLPREVRAYLEQALATALPAVMGVEPDFSDGESFFLDRTGNYILLQNLPVKTGEGEAKSVDMILSHTGAVLYWRLSASGNPPVTDASGISDVLERLDHTASLFLQEQTWNSLYGQPTIGSEMQEGLPFDFSGESPSQFSDAEKMAFYSAGILHFVEALSGNAVQLEELRAILYSGETLHQTAFFGGEAALIFSFEGAALIYFYDPAGEVFTGFAYRPA